MKVAIFGIGKSGTELMNELANHSSISQLMIFDPELPKLTQNFESSAEIVFCSSEIELDSSFNLAVIASPDHLHAGFVLEALSHGVNCFVEKPLVTKYHDLRQISQILKTQPDLKLTTNFVLRAAPLFIRLKKLINEGVFGSRMFIEGKYLYGRWNKIQNGWRGLPEEDYSVVLGGLIHLVDLACYLSGSFDFEVEIERKRLTSLSPRHISDFGQVRMYSDAVGVVSLTTTFSSPVQHRRDLAIYSDCGWIEILGDSIRTGGDLRNLGLEQLSARSNSKAILLHQFVNSLIHETIPERHFPDREEVLRLHEILLAP